MNALYYLIAALIQVESNGDTRAQGDFVNGRPTAFGCLQISRSVVLDVERITKMRIPIESVFDMKNAVWICEKYLKHYATKERLGREPTTEDLARIWNGGPNGWCKPETNIYWLRVRKVLNGYAGVWSADYQFFTPATMKKMPRKDTPKNGVRSPVEFENPDKGDEG